MFYVALIGSELLYVDFTLQLDFVTFVFDDLFI